MKIDPSVPSPEFGEFPLDRSIQRGIAAAGFERTRPVQAATLPAGLEGRDVLGLAQTGTGKTAAFVLPILQSLSESTRRGPRALIVAPTRELAMQIEAETLLLAKFCQARVVTIFGGVSASRQIRGMQNKPDIIVACPGRLLDLMNQRHVDLSRVETLVLDEADHMFDMGFLPDIRKILAALPERRQNMMFSATMPREIRKLADKVLVNPHVVELANSAPAETIEHALYPVADDSKFALLRNLLGSDELTSAIVFSRTKHRAKKLAVQLGRNGYEAVALQGNMSQGQRDRAMKGFRSRRFNVLVATDIAARGIDVAGVSHVINFDVPNTPEAYTHRIGRTGRAELTGKAYTLITNDDAEQVDAIERRIGSSIERRIIEGFGGEEVGTRRARTGRKPAPGRRRNHHKHGGGGGRGGGRGAKQGAGASAGHGSKSGGKPGAKHSANNGSQSARGSGVGGNGAGGNGSRGNGPRANGPRGNAGGGQGERRGGGQDAASPRPYRGGGGNAIPKRGDGGGQSRGRRAASTRS